MDVGRSCSYIRLSRVIYKAEGDTCLRDGSDSGAAECRVSDAGLESVSENIFSVVARASSVMIQEESNEFTLCRTSPRRPAC
jgi:hypothetical protein